MIYPFDLGLARVRRDELLREAEERRMARVIRGVRRGEGRSGGLESVEATSGLAEEEPTLIVPLYRASGR